MYFVTIDMLLCGQYMYYQCGCTKQQDDKESLLKSKLEEEEDMLDSEQGVDVDSNPVMIKRNGTNRKGVLSTDSATSNGSYGSLDGGHNGQNSINSDDNGGGRLSGDLSNAKKPNKKSKSKSKSKSSTNGVSGGKLLMLVFVVGMFIRPLGSHMISSSSWSSSSSLFFSSSDDSMTSSVATQEQLAGGRRSLMEFPYVKERDD
eukprot:TRINITY_DN10635_c0_g1_i2.p1 TRINITY_DN10635_c0_g1~~TRINITY_DN10635_c0_g1_i2.p1  ORF type:complete len:203 (-),score=77.64 TRINITY_DN10635_c0_g1_i2:464-1072(-)